MSDTVSLSARELSDKAKNLANESHYAQAAELYRQSYDLYPSAYVASQYIRCLRKEEKSEVAVEFGRYLPKRLLDDKYVKKAFAWSIYDVYLKKSDIVDTRDDEFGEVEQKMPRGADFEKMQRAASRILTMSSEEDGMLRTRTILAFCSEAKRRGNWQVMYDFAHQLDPEQLSVEEKEWNGRKLPSDHQHWFSLTVRALLELKRYDECIENARKGIEKFPNEKLFHWWLARAKLALGQVTEALSDFESIDIRFPKEWYIQRDIADGYIQLQKYDDAWVWFCKAASCQGDIKGRFKMFEQMSMLLEHLGRWQEAHDHLQLARLIAEREHWEHAFEGLQGKLLQFRKRHAGQLITFPVGASTETLSSLFQRCRVLWQETLSASREHSRGSISRVNKEEGYGFIEANNGDIHFRFRNMAKGVTPVVGMKVEFEIEKSYDQKKQRDSVRAVNIRPLANRT